uniref:Uncharacterized protein n=1 Tax=Setaria italica TaxID=4555 RepID=K3ZMT8_SETIT
MKRFLRCLSRTIAAAKDGDGPAAAASGHLRQKKGKGVSAGVVPEGHAPVCFDEEGGPVERFTMRAELLDEPAFVALLRHVVQDYGYAHSGEFHYLLLRRLPLCLSDNSPFSPSCNVAAQ